MNAHKKIMFLIRLLIMVMCPYYPSTLATTYGVQYILFKKDNTTLHVMPRFQSSYVLGTKNFSQFILRFNLCYSGLGATPVCKPIHFYIYAKKTKKTDEPEDSVKFFFVREKKDHSIESGFIKVDKYELRRKRITIRGEVIYKDKTPRNGDMLFVESGLPLKKLKNCKELEKLVEDKFKPILEKEFSEYLACQD